MKQNWPFTDSPNTAAFTSRYVLQAEPICHVYRDWEDGAWQFLPDRVTDPSDGELVCLAEILKLDDSIGELADLQPGWAASRKSRSGPWLRRKNHEFPEFRKRGFYLEDVTEYEPLFPERYNIPNAERRENLRVGDTVKLIFRFAGEEDSRTDNQCERMWVEILQVDNENSRYRGKLLNEPVLHKEIRCGCELWFHALHVLAIHEPPV